MPKPIAVNNGDGYKAAIYEDFPPYGGPYSDYARAGSRDVGLAYGNQAQCYPPPVTSNMYTEPTPAFPADDWFPDHPCLHPLPAPMMAPLPIGERYVQTHDGFSQVRGHATVPEPTYPKEEKPTGGVSAKLDYDMDQMTDFVAETTVTLYGLFSSNGVTNTDPLRSIKPGQPVLTTFRKWILQVLNATRLPSTTIMLSLSYLAIRLRLLSTEKSFRVDERTYYKMTTVALILGSKFLDDNTFQNKSWAEVSNIPVRELNRDEREWLVALNHRLHHDPRRVDGFEVAQEQWKNFQAKANARLPALQPLDTNLRRHHSMQALSTLHPQSSHPKNSLRNFALDPALFDRSFNTSGYAQYGNGWHDSGYHSSMEQSPLSSASHSGPQTPEYLNGTGYGWGPFNQFGPRPQYTYPPAGPYGAPHTFSSEFQLPPFPNHCVTAWNCHGPQCQCQMCRSQNPILPRFNHPIMA